jgi:LacI family transcriptional regulator
MSRVTLSEIARLAGVDVSTVSRALNSREGVRKEVRERVLEVAQRLNYRPNLLARSLITGRSQTIGLLISDIRNPFFTDFARGAEDAANAAGYDVLLCNSDLNPAKHMKYFWSLVAKSVDGIVMNSISFLEPGDIQQMVESGVPIVLLNRPPRGSQFSTVLSDNTHGGSLAAEYLIKLGHRRTAMPGCEEPILIRGDYNAEGGHAMMNKLLGSLNGVTAIFAANDAIAFGAIRAIWEAGLRIPDDLSLVGFDDVEMAAIVHPPLTTVRQPKHELGAAAVEILIKQSVSKSALPEHRAFGVELVERSSCRQLS